MTNDELHESKRPAPHTLIEPDNGVITVANCVACRGDHRRIPYKPMSQTLGLFNHYYTCEQTGEPVPVSLAALDGKTLEIPQFMAAAVVRAAINGRWLFFVARIEDGEIKLDRQTNNFPREDLPQAVDMLAADLRKELDPMNGKQIHVHHAPPEDVLSLFRRRHQA